MTFIAAILIGITAGSRTMMAPAAVAWGSWLGWIDPSPTWATFMSSIWALVIFTLFALGELVTDQLPTTPSRKTPPQFGARIVSGAFAGAVVGTLGGATVIGFVMGVAGAVAGTLGGAALRGRLANAAAIGLGLLAVGLAA